MSTRLSATGTVERSTGGAAEWRGELAWAYEPGLPLRGKLARGVTVLPALPRQDALVGGRKFMATSRLMTDPVPAAWVRSILLR